MTDQNASQTTEIGENLTLTWYGLHDSPRVRVILHGRMDTTNSGDTIDHLTEMLGEDPEMDELILDLSGIFYASSTGIGVLTTILTKSRQAGVRLKLANVGANIRSVLDLLGFSPFFDFASLE